MEYKPTYRPTIDITKRFNEFLKHEITVYGRMDVLTEQMIDKYFRGEINIEELNSKCGKSFGYILAFEKYEYEHKE